MVVQMFLFVVPNVFLMMVAIISYGPGWGAVISFLEFSHLLLLDI